LIGNQPLLALLDQIALDCERIGVPHAPQIAYNYRSARTPACRVATHGDAFKH
jgi:hypothetical protein